MDLEGQGGQRGYAMAALLVGIAVMAVLMSAAMPVWRHQAQREKEAELIFRGLQYARAIQLYQRKNGPGNLPPSVDILVQQRFLRKKYKDPMTEDGEFQLLHVGQQPGQPSGANPGRGGQPTGRGQSPQPQQTGQPGGFTGGTTGGILGVASKSTASSIKLYMGRTHYNEWQFIAQAIAQNPGGGRGRGTPGGEGRGGPGTGTGIGPGRGTGPGGRGTGPAPGGPGGRGANPGFPGPGGRRGGQ